MSSEFVEISNKKMEINELLERFTRMNWRYGKTLPMKKLQLSQNINLLKVRVRIC